MLKTHCNEMFLKSLLKYQKVDIWSMTFFIARNLDGILWPLPMEVSDWGHVVEISGFIGGERKDKRLC